MSRGFQLHERMRPKLALLVSLVLGSIAIIQIVVVGGLLLLGQSAFELGAISARLSLLDQVAMLGLASTLAVAMKHLFQLRKRAVTWFSVYLGIGSWTALFYSLSSIPKPHFDELASMAGILFAASLLAYLRKLDFDGVLK